MKKTLTLAVLGLLLSLSHSSFATIYGSHGTCVGGTTYMTDTSTLGISGTWSSSNTAVATVDPLGAGLMANIHGISAGTATIYFTDGVVTDSYAYTVTPPPAPISGTTFLCAGTTATLSDATAGGTWVSDDVTMATVNPTTGVVTGVSAGWVWISYYSGPGCSVSILDTVNSASPGTIYGDSILCLGSVTTLGVYTYGGSGIWSSSNPAVASISSTGTVTGVSAGVATITYNYSGVCGTGLSTIDIFITTTSTLDTITGTTSLSTGSTAWLGDLTYGGTWSSSNTAVATIDASTGMLTGVAPGTATITYTISGCSGPQSTTTVVTVSVANCIAGDVLFTGASYFGPVKVWLIKYDAATHLLTAADSILVYSSGSSATYQFCGMDTATYRVKAATGDSSASASGYVPTYHTNSFYWNTATTFFHAASTYDGGKDIVMGTGTATSGPGFISGDVTTGANKGTSGSIPSVGLLIYAQDDATGTILQHTKTDASGYYSFSNLPAGTYRIYPELMNYATTPYTAVALSSAAPAMTAASFVQHTVSYKITPITAAVGNVATASSYISTFPNPTNGKLNVNYEVRATEQADVTVKDVTGRSVYSATISLTKGAGNASIDLSAISNGLYLISIKSASVNYNNKVQVQK